MLHRSPEHNTFNHRNLNVLTSELLGMGAAIVVIKLGEAGLFARVTNAVERLQALGAGEPRDFKAWLGRQQFAPSYRVEVVGTTGAGDSSIAGFLFGLLRGFDLDETLNLAAATAACCCEAADATSGVRSWPEIQQRQRTGWPRMSTPAPR